MDSRTAKEAGGRDGINAMTATELLDAKLTELRAAMTDADLHAITKAACCPVPCLALAELRDLMGDQAICSVVVNWIGKERSLRRNPHLEGDN